MKGMEIRKEAGRSGAAVGKLLRDMENELYRDMAAYRARGEKLTREKLGLHRDHLDALCLGNEQFKGIVEEDQKHLHREYKGLLKLREQDYLVRAEGIDGKRRKEAEKDRKSLKEERTGLLTRIALVQEESDAYEKEEAKKAAARRQKEDDRRTQKALRRETRARIREADDEIRAIRAEGRRDMVRDRLENAALARERNSEIFRRRLEARAAEARLELMRARKKLEEFSRKAGGNENEQENPKAV